MMMNLIKMEFKSCYQKIGVALLGSVVIGVLLFFSSSMRLIDVTVAALLAFLWSIALFAVFGLFIYNVVTAFTKRIYSNEGYLSLTLPVSSFQLVVSKLIVQLIWLVLIFGAMIVLTFLIGMTLNVSIGAMLDGMVYAISSFFEEPTAWAALFNGLASILFSISSVWFFISLMNTKIVRSKRTLLAMIAFVAFNILFNNILQMVYENVLDGYYYISTMTSLGGFASPSDWLTYYMLDGAIHLVIGGLFFYGIIYLLDNHIELE